MKALAGLVAAFALAGCVGDPPAADDQAPCTTPVGETLLRDPATGTCRLYQTGGCDSPTACASSPAYPACTGACEGLAEDACLARTSCHAAYRGGAGVAVFHECWEASSTQLGSVAQCDQLDPLNCTRISSCISVRDATTAPYRCDFEPSRPAPPRS